MNVTFPKGQPKVTLTKADRNQMLSVRGLLGNLAKHVNGQVQQAALTAEAGLTKVLAEFRDDAAEGQPEAASGDQREGVRELLSRSNAAAESPTH